MANLGSLIHMDIEDVGIQYGLKSNMKVSTATMESESASYKYGEDAYSDVESVSYTSYKTGPVFNLSTSLLYKL